MPRQVIPAAEIETVPDAGTIYVHDPDGVTRIRIGGIKNMPAGRPSFIDITLSEGGRISILEKSPDNL